MKKWSKIRKKLENEYLAPSLRGRIQYFVTTYSYCPDHEGRASVMLDGKEIIASGYYNQFGKFSEAYREIKEAFPNMPATEIHKKAYTTACENGGFDQTTIYGAFYEFDNQSIEKSLVSDNPFVKLFAVLDRRVGKRRLLKLKKIAENECGWLKKFLKLRLTAEFGEIDKNSYTI